MADRAEVEKQKKIFSQYLSDKRILIADPSSTSRAALANILASMGAKTSLISLVGQYSYAEEEVKKNNPTIVITEYDLGKQCGLELLQNLRAQNADLKKSLFVLVTGNTSQTAVARSAEEDVDTYIIKPFTPETLRATIMKTALAKIQPSKYITTIDEGKVLLGQGKIEEAIAKFTEAIQHDKSPALALFYLGQANTLKQLLDAAEGKFNEGLDHNKIHYKCLVGLYEVLMTQKRHADAYEAIKKISHYFPANPKRLTSVLRLAIMTKSYEDVERYYRMFTNIDTRNDEMVKYICAALVVCGKYYLQQSSQSRALELFQKAAVSAAGRTRVLRDIIVTLVEFDQLKQTEEYLKRFPAETRTGPDYIVSEMLVNEKIKSNSLVLEQGRKAIQNGLVDFTIYEITIRCSARLGLAEAAEELALKATKQWPEKKDYLAKLITTHMKPISAAAG